MNKLKSLIAPISVNLEVTDQCNLKCFFCFCGTEAYKNSLSSVSTLEKTKNAKRILDILAKNCIFEVRLFGGEFSLLKNWKNIVEYAFGLDFFISFVSNGTIFNKKDIEFLIDKRIMNCSISMHGLNNLHDQIVGYAGSFKKASQNIKLLSAGGVKVSVPFTPTKINILHFEKFALTMIEKYGASSVGVNRLFRSNRYENLSFSDYEYLLNIIEKLQNDGLPVFFIDSFPYCKVSPKYWKYMSNCSQGVGFCQIDYMGNIKNCSSLCLNIGNVFQESLQDIWQNKLSEFRTLKHLPLSCRLCPLFCGGGCIASRTIEHNFIADEFIKLPNEETMIESIAITAKNYVKKWYSKRYTKPIIKKIKKKWQLFDRPHILRRYKIRKEKNDCYLCMIEERGTVILNEKSFLILKFVDGNRTIEQIEKELSQISSLKINKEEIIEILDIFID
ncbi:radical SAM protein [bacterium]|nr:radical SAM protein [bacterium]